MATAAGRRGSPHGSLFYVNGQRPQWGHITPCTNNSSQQESSMFKKILIPVDGSDLSLRAAATGVQLAKEVGAQVVFLHGMAPYIAPYAAEISMVDDKTQIAFEKSVTDGSSRCLRTPEDCRRGRCGLRDGPCRQFTSRDAHREDRP